MKPLEWTDGEALFADEGPTYAEAVRAGYTYVAEAVDKPIAESKLDA